ncbi:hypothetical protein CCR85_01445 [Rhodothalassium salexigens]|uniref:type I secretion system permease/ATPase n=1 Tax=Rhodothalassium salexigens TaxID=1086 RepID=UPI0019131DDA|nr:type I secretion system permease/ATPase [Rhodothalassium salexigens]MBK5910157.1 hypothetical protein [Rhodothalassium salexigens]MBK5920779.1 hypothetical protein [Rhodothalassium salexigens]
MANRSRGAAVPRLVRELMAELRGGLVWTGVFSMFINVLMLTTPFYMLQIYDRVLTSGSVPTLLYLTLVGVFLLAMMGLLELARSRLLVRVSGRIDRKLGDPVFARMVDASLSRGAGRAEPLRDLEKVRSFATGPGIIALFDAPWSPIFFAVIFLLHPVLGLLALSGGVLLFVLALVSEWLTRKPLTEAGSMGQRAQWYAEDCANNAEVVAALGMTDGVRARWRDAYAQSLGHQALASDRSGLLTALTKFVRPALQMAMLGAGAFLVLAQEVSPGAMIAGSIMLGRALAPIQTAIAQWRNVIQTRQAYHRLKDFLADAPDAPEPMALPRPRGDIQVERLVAPAPGGEQPVIKGIGFAIPAGTSVGIIGPSAAGKSSLARLLVGVWTPSHGAVRLDGADVAQWDRAQLGPHIGYLPQSVALLEGSVKDNIARFGPVDPDKVVKAAERAGVHQMILRLADGYDTDIGRTGAALSPGQRQRIALARAIYGDPALVVLDEPNASLDSDGEAALKRCLDALRRDATTVVVISHRPSLLSDIDRLLVLADGKIETYGPRDEVMKKLVRSVPKPNGNAGPGDKARGGPAPDDKAPDGTDPQGKARGDLAAAPGAGDRPAADEGPGATGPRAVSAGEGQA